MTQTEHHQKFARWMQLYIAELLGEPSENIEVTDPIAAFDLDSIDTVTMTIEMENKFEIRLSPEFFWNGKLSISDIANQICEEIA
jgi:acyl carrier protein